MVAFRATPEEKNGDDVARLGDEVVLKHLVQLDEHHVELRPDNHNAEHEPRQINLAKNIVRINGVTVGAPAVGR